MFAGELDILECRLATMAPYDVTHVIVESDTDNHGRAKPYTLEKHLKWHERVTYIKASGIPGPSAWEREHQQRDEALRVVREDAIPGDWVLIADVDEIPAPWLLETPRRGMLMMRNMMLTLDRALPAPQPTSVMIQWPFDGALSWIRDNRYGMTQIIPGGWHLSWLGGEEAIQRKLAMHCHTWAETQAQLSQLVPNDDMPPWCRYNAPASWFTA